MSCSSPQPNSLLAWLDDRLGISTLLGIASKKEVPVHKHSIWYYLGGAIGVLILAQLVTGILLMFYYVPEVKSAHSSILFINTKIDFGWFIRSLHSWGANLMIMLVFIHMFSTFFLKAYRPPREITWLTGMGLLILALGFGFTGYLLPWDDVSFFATKIGLDITTKLPFVGEWMAHILRGGDTVGQATISRFFAIHVMVLPVLLAGLAGIHLLIVQLKGMSAPESFHALPDKEKEYEKFFPQFLLKDFLFWLLILNLLATLVVLSPWGLGPEADPFAPAPLGIKPEWYFLAMFQFLKVIPPQLGPIEGEMAGIGLFGLIALAFLAAPFIDNGKRAVWSKVYQWFGIIIVLGFIVFTVWGAL